MNNYNKIPYVLMIVWICCCAAVAFEFHSQNVAQEEGYTDGYNEYNKTMYNYTSQYIEVKSGTAEYSYNYGYCEGYNARTVDDMKPE
jgi:hypothetical protein